MKEMVIKQFFPVKGSHMTQEQAERYGPELAALEEENKILTPQFVVNAARKKKSPLNDWFTWDDSIAAEKHRQQEARYMMNFINVKVVKPDGAEDEIRYLHNVRITEPDSDIEGMRGYVSAPRVFSNEDHAKQVCDNALRSLRAFARKYGQYSDLSPRLGQAFEYVQGAIDTLIDTEVLEVA
jgi:hypothetical protein